MVHCTPVPDIKMDSYPGSLAQVLINLLSNALAHAFEDRERGSVQISLRKVGEGYVEICVSDDGVGIPQDNLKRVFDPFFTTKLGRGGSGLGMHIVYNLVTGVLGGKVTLKSEPGKGTQVTVKVPRVAKDKS